MLISCLIHRGCGLNARLANYYGEKFEAFGFFAVPYSPPLPFDLAAINAMSKQVFGYDNFGYWNFFAKEEAAKIIEEHVSRLMSGVTWSNRDIQFESFVCLLYPKNEEVFRNNFCRDGALEKWLLSDSKCESTPIAISKVGFSTSCLSVIWYSRLPCRKDKPNNDHS